MEKSYFVLYTADQNDQYDGFKDIFSYKRYLLFFRFHNAIFKQWTSFENVVRTYVIYIIGVVDMIQIRRYNRMKIDRVRTARFPLFGRELRKTTRIRT